MTSAEKRARLRQYMADCPACVPEDADGVADEELDAWLTSHDENWAAAPPQHGDGDRDA